MIRALAILLTLAGPGALAGPGESHPLDGTWTLVDREDAEARAERAVQGAIAAMGFPLRMLARGPLRTRLAPSRQVRFAIHDEAVLVVLDDGTFRTSRADREIDVRRYGDPVHLRQWSTHAAVVQQFRGAGGTRTDTWRTGPDGHLLLVTELRSSRLPAPVRVEQRYRRAGRVEEPTPSRGGAEPGAG